MKRVWTPQTRFTLLKEWKQPDGHAVVHVWAGGAGAAVEHHTELLLCSRTPQAGAFMPPACQDQNSLSHDPRAGRGSALNVTVTELPSRVLPSG